MSESNQIDRIAGSIAGAFVDAVRREGLLRRSSETQGNNGRLDAATTRERTQSQTTISDSHSRVATILARVTPSSRSSRGSSGSSSTAFERALELHTSMRRDCGVSSSGRNTSRSLFLSAFSRPAKRGKKCAISNAPVGPRPSVYVRDIICLPNEYKCSDDGSTIPIPRGSSRARLAEAGLFGKVKFTSVMSEDDIKLEICRAFMQPMGICESDLADGIFFPFHYLQRTGAGSRSLCMPAVSNNFHWNGKQVASLCKSGGYMYILADKELPGLKSLDSQVEVCIIICIFFVSFS